MLTGLGIPLDSFMRLCENIDPIAIKVTKFQKERERSSIRRGDGGAVVEVVGVGMRRIRVVAF